MAPTSSTLNAPSSSKELCQNSSVVSKLGTQEAEGKTFNPQYDLNLSSDEIDSDVFCTQPPKPMVEMPIVDHMSIPITQEIPLPQSQTTPPQSCGGSCNLDVALAILQLKDTILAQNKRIPHTQCDGFCHEDFVGVLEKVNSTMQSLGSVLISVCKNIQSSKQHNKEGSSTRSLQRQKSTISSSKICGKSKGKKPDTVGSIDNAIELDPNFDETQMTSPTVNSKKRKTGGMEKAGGVVNLSAIEQPDLVLALESLFRANRFNIVKEWVLLSDTHDLHYTCQSRDTFDIRLTGNTLRTYVESKAELGVFLRRAFTRMLQFKEGVRMTDPSYLPKHFFTADCRTIAGNNSYQIEAFMQPSRAYITKLCRTFIAMVDFNVSWVCYSFDINNKVACIIDPLAGNSDSQIVLRRHEDTKNFVLARILEYIRNVFEDRRSADESWKTKVIQNMPEKYIGNNYGYMALVCAEFVDTVNATMGEVPGGIKEYKSQMVDDLLKLPTNMASSPAS